jgi:1A family penicillin-binding protein
MIKKRTLLLSIFALLILLSLAGAAWVLYDLPSVDALGQHTVLPSVRITDRSGRLLYEMLPGGEGRHTVVDLKSLPLALQQATIATEDSTFYQNPGVDLGGILRAVWINLQGGETLAGGSTITQQVARTLLMSDQERAQRSLRRKLRETVLAWELAQRYSKEEILALYLNQTYYGAMNYGVEAAAQTYFAKPASDLDLAEAALIAGLPQSPAAYNPFTDLDAAKKRQAVVLGLMEKQGFITSEQRSLAEREPLVLASSPYPLEAPHFVMMVRSQLDGLFTLEQIEQSGGLVVRTGLDLDWQHLAENAVAQQLERLHNSPNPVSSNVNNAAVVVLDPHSGEIRAMVGSPDYFDAAHSGALNMAISPRQPGSALKPFIYAAALDPTQPSPWTPATMLLDVTTHFTTHDGKLYAPVNYDGKEHGPVLVREALASSLNVPAVLALDHVGLQNLFNLLSSLGIRTMGEPDQYDLSFALGGGEVRLLDLTAAYGALANGGYPVHPVSILEVTDRQGNVLYTRPQYKAARVLDERVTWLISDILSDDNARLLGFGRNSALKLDRPAAVKTGTTTNFHDNWTVGYTPSLVVGVWAGNASHEAMHDVTGLTGAGPIWHQVMRSILAGQPEETFTRPQGIEQAEVCALSGLIPGRDCAYRKTDWFIAGTQPKTLDSFYRSALVDKATGTLADASTPPERVQKVVALDLPPQAEPWARARDLLLWKDLQKRAPAQTAENSTAPAAAAPALALISPADHAIYHITATLPLADQRIRFAAVSQANLSVVRLYVDGVVYPMLPGSDGQSPYSAWWALSPGSHTAWVVAVQANGDQLVSDKVSFEVKGE